MFENIIKFFKKTGKKETLNPSSKDTAKERLHLVLMQDRANVSADFLDLMRQEIIEVIKKYIDIDESAMDVRLTNQANDDGTQGAPALYANIPILNIKAETRRLKKDDGKIKEEKKSEEKINEENKTEEKVKKEVEPKKATRIEENKNETKKEITKTENNEKKVKDENKKIEETKKIEEAKKIVKEKVKTDIDKSKINKVEEVEKNKISLIDNEVKEILEKYSDKSIEYFLNLIVFPSLNDSGDSIKKQKLYDFYQKDDENYIKTGNLAGFIRLDNKLDFRIKSRFGGNTGDVADDD